MSASFPRFLIIRVIYPELASVVEEELQEKFPECVFTEEEILFISSKILGYCFVSHLYEQEPDLYNKKLKDVNTAARSPKRLSFEPLRKLTAQDYINIKFFFKRNRVAVIKFYNKRRNFLEQKNSKE